jgi:hypothetical protein
MVNSKRTVAASASLLFLFVVAAPSEAQTPFVLATQGCWQAHCDQHLSGALQVAAPLAATTAVVVEKKSPGASTGLGCSSNYQVVACSYHSNFAAMVVYDSSGNRIFDSGTLLDNQTYASAPLVSADGEVIVADDKTLVRYAPNGTIIWQTAIQGTGTPISPVITANGVIVLATLGGIISSYSVATGTPVGTLSVRFDGLSYETINTPSVNGNRVYVSMSADHAESFGRLVAIDVNPAASSPLDIAWTFAFGGPSGASPVFLGGVVYFDGSSLLPGPAGVPVLFALQDLGTSPSLLWVDQLVSGQDAPTPAILTSPLPDPRGGLWFYVGSQSTMRRVDANTGATLQSIDMNSFCANTWNCLPSTALMMASINPSTGDPVMVLGLGTLIAGTTKGTGPSFALAVDLGTTPSMLWNVQIAPVTASNFIYCQFAVVAGPNGSPLVVFPGASANTYFVGAPASAPSLQ